MSAEIGLPAGAEPPADAGRRAALARLGLAVTAAYAAPMVLHLDRAANAQVVPTPCNNQGGGQGVPTWCRRRGR